MELRLFVTMALGVGLVCCQACQGDESAELLMQATVKLVNESSTAGGLVVESASDGDKGADRYLVTANHVLTKMSGDSCVIVARVLGDNQEYQRKEHRVQIRRGNEVLWRKHPQHDLAVLPLPKELEVNSLPLKCIATKETLESVHSGEDVILAVYPERNESHRSGFPVLRTGIISSFPIKPAARNPILWIDSTTWPGDSGGPVMHKTLRVDDSLPLVIGVVRGMRSLSDVTRESRFVEKRTLYPLGICEAMQITLIHDILSKDR